MCDPFNGRASQLTNLNQNREKGTGKFLRQLVAGFRGAKAILRFNIGVTDSAADLRDIIPDPAYNIALMPARYGEIVFHTMDISVGRARNTKADRFQPPTNGIITYFERIHFRG